MNDHWVERDLADKYGDREPHTPTWKDRFLLAATVVVGVFGAIGWVLMMLVAIGVPAAVMWAALNLFSVSWR